MHISYPKPIAIQRGHTVNVLVAHQTDHDWAMADCISVVETGVSFQLDPHECAALYTEDVKERIARYSEQPEWSFPMLAQVLSCAQYGPGTAIEVDPISQRPWEYHEMIEDAWRASLPAFWQRVDEREEWRRSFVLTGEPLRRARERRPAEHTQLAIELARAAHLLFEAKCSVDLPRLMTAVGGCEAKLATAQRHLDRISALRDVRRALYEAGETDGREFALSETRQETAVAFEALAVAVYSALDILARAIDYLYLITVSPTQRASRVGFLRLIEGRGIDDNSTQAARYLQRDFAEDPLTKLLSAERDGWIRELAEIRHNVVHETHLQVCEVVRGGVSVGLPRGLDPKDLIRFDFRDAVELGGSWVQSARRVVHSAFDIMRRRAEEMASSAESPDACYPPHLLQQHHTPHFASLYRALDAWQAVPTESSEAVECFYGCLTRDWRSRWPIDRCRELLASRNLVSYGLGTMTMGSDGTGGQISRARVRMGFAEGAEDWWFCLVPEGGIGQWRLALLPLSSFPSPTPRVAATELWAAQSGLGSGHRDMLIGGQIANDSDRDLTDVRACVLVGGSPAPFVYELVEQLLGDLPARATGQVYLRAKDAYLPVAGPPIALQPTFLRVVYRTDEGDTWHEDFPIQNRLGAGEGETKQVNPEG